jgi:hypothetical protein
MYRLHIFTLINVVYYNCCLLCDDLCTTSHSSTFRTEKPRFNRHFVGPSLHISCETQTPNNNFPYYLNLCAQTVNTKCKKNVSFLLCYVFYVAWLHSCFLKLTQYLGGEFVSSFTGFCRLFLHHITLSFLVFMSRNWVCRERLSNSIDSIDTTNDNVTALSDLAIV